MQFISLISSVLLSGLLLLSSTGIRVSQHWCGDKLVNATLWGEADPCDHASKKVSCPIHGEMDLSKNCCSEKEVQIKGGDKNYHPTQYFIEQPPSDEITLISNFFTSFKSVQKVARHWRNHSPPLLTNEIFILFESLLI